MRLYLGEAFVFLLAPLYSSSPIRLSVQNGHTKKDKYTYSHNRRQIESVRSCRYDKLLQTLCIVLIDEREYIVTLLCVNVDSFLRLWTN